MKRAHKQMIRNTKYFTGRTVNDYHIFSSSISRTPDLEEIIHKFIQDYNRYSVSALVTWSIEDIYESSKEWFRIMDRAIEKRYQIATTFGRYEIWNNESYPDEFRVIQTLDAQLKQRRVISNKMKVALRGLYVLLQEGVQFERIEEYLSTMEGFILDALEAEARESSIGGKPGWLLEPRITCMVPGWLDEHTYQCERLKIYLRDSQNWRYRCLGEILAFEDIWTHSFADAVDLDQSWGRGNCEIGSALLTSEGFGSGVATSR